MMVRVVASVAADDVHGEVPMVPADVEALCEAADPAVADLRAIGEIIRQVRLPPPPHIIPPIFFPTHHTVFCTFFAKPCMYDF